jgi:EAL domain-containing protein (putative c-di-GMP-specific phosphodiesterase class I)
VSKTAPIAAEDAKPHYEILLGLRDKDRKTQLPGVFIQRSELYGRAIQVDRWVIENTFRWMSENKRRLIRLSGFSINVSAQSLSDVETLPFVLDQFTRSRLPPGKVLFEVTETAAIQSLSNAENFIRVLKEYGARFLLDDFGTGHSSYSYLKHLPIDYVKFDGLFIKDIVDNKNDQAMVKSITEVGHFMGKKTIAEFVENNQILEQLRITGVDYAQGYAIERPRLLAELS